MEKNLLVPYKSQWDADASETRDDCGPACLSMCLDYYGEKTTVNQVFKKTGAGKDQLITIAQLINACAAYEYTAQYYVNKTLDDIRQLIDKDTPVVVLIHYGDFSSRQDTGYAGGHFALVVGYRDDGFFVNDPDFWGNFRKDGDHHFYTKEDFIKGWGNCGKDGNPNNSYVVLHRKQAVKPTTEVFTEQLELYRKQSEGFERICDILGKPHNPDIIISEVNQLLSLEQSLVQKDKQLSDAKEQAQNLQDQATKQKDALTDLTNTLGTLKNETDQKIQSLQDQLRSKDNDISSLQAEIKTLQNNVSLPTLNRWELIIKALFG
jgi:hypothetical protein